MTMKVRTRRKALNKLQRASSRLAQWGKDARFIGGAKWSRADQAKLRQRGAQPLVFNTVGEFGANMTIDPPDVQEARNRESSRALARLPMAARKHP
mgnify:CR=1 FL=1